MGHLLWAYQRKMSLIYRQFMVLIKTIEFSWSQSPWAQIKPQAYTWPLSLCINNNREWTSNWGWLWSCEWLTGREGADSGAAAVDANESWHRMLDCFTVTTKWQQGCLWGKGHGLLLSRVQWALLPADPNIDWGTPHKWCIMGARDRWEFPAFCKGQWQSPCTTLTAGKCLPLGMCMRTVKKSNRMRALWVTRFTARFSKQFRIMTSGQRSTIQNRLDWCEWPTVTSFRQSLFPGICGCFSIV